MLLTPQITSWNVKFCEFIVSVQAVCHATTHFDTHSVRCCPLLHIVQAPVRKFQGIPLVSYLRYFVLIFLIFHFFLVILYEYNVPLPLSLTKVYFVQFEKHKQNLLGFWGNLKLVSLTTENVCFKMEDWKWVMKKIQLFFMFLLYLTSLDYVRICSKFGHYYCLQV